MASDLRHTFHAGQAFELSELVNLRFSQVRYGKQTPRFIQMSPPDGPSTDDGRKSRHSLVLIRNHHDSGIVFGFVDLFKKTADIKPYSVVRQQFETRFQGELLDLSNSDYNQAVEDLKEFLKNHSIETRVVNRSRNSSSVVSPPPSPSRIKISVPLIPILLSAMLGFLLCYLLVAVGILPTSL